MTAEGAVGSPAPREAGRVARPIRWRSLPSGARHGGVASAGPASACSGRSGQPLPLPPLAGFGTLVLVMTDVVGSTRLWREEPVAMDAAMRRHHEIVHGAVAGHGGVRPVGVLAHSAGR